MESDIFQYDSYKAYLNAKLDDRQGGGGRGSRSRLSKAIGCQTAFVAQVLRGGAHFSLEQAEAASDFLGHNEEEGHFLLLLIQRERAGTPRLKQRFEKQISQIRQSRLILKNRLDVRESLSEQDQVIYYSSWHYAAIHALVSIPGHKSIESLARHLQMDLRTVSDCVQFLLSCGLVVRNGDKGGLCPGKARIHLGSDSPLIGKHHINWKLQAIRAIENPSIENLHYSSVVSLSEKDTVQVREILTSSITKVKSIVKDSPGELVRCFSMDLFGI